MPGKFEKSCGVIPFCKTSRGLRFLLVRNIGGHWEFPKGHIEKGETERETARREFFEETGLKVKKLLKNSYLEHYTYFWKKRKKNKIVTYFLGEVKFGKVVFPEDEIIDFEWLSYRGALKKLTYKEVREILREARVELSNYLS